MTRGPEDALPSTPGAPPDRPGLQAFRDAHRLELQDILARIELRIHVLKGMLADHREDQRRRFPGACEDADALEGG